MPGRRAHDHAYRNHALPAGREIFGCRTRPGHDTLGPSQPVTGAAGRAEGRTRNVDIHGAAHAALPDHRSPEEQHPCPILPSTAAARGGLTTTFPTTSIPTTRSRSMATLTLLA